MYIHIYTYIYIYIYTRVKYHENTFLLFSAFALSGNTIAITLTEPYLELDAGRFYCHFCAPGKDSFAPSHSYMDQQTDIPMMHQL